jgi:peptidoglycan/xylan/chitin deacetylase (PgdA/CDA1 family)
MTVSIALKRGYARWLESLGVVSRRLRSGGPAAVILMYHRVLPRAGLDGCVQEGMYVEPATLAAHLRFLEERFEVVPLHDIPSALSGGKGGRFYCALTFDDGWADFREHAYPILKERRLAATVFLPTDYIGTGRRFWTDRLAHLLRFGERAGGPADPVGAAGESLAGQVERIGGGGAGSLERAVALLKNHREEEIEEALDVLSGRRGNPPPPGGRAFLSWEEVREIAGEGLVSFGSHGTSHRILTLLDGPEIRRELSESRKRLLAEGAAVSGTLTLSYPNGNCDRRIGGMAGEEGYLMAVSTKRGWNAPGADLFDLRRIGIHQDMASTLPLLGCRIAGLL